jgi:hypothetical protein
MEWIRRLRYRALAWFLAILLAAVATVAFAGVPWLPLAGVAFAAVAMSVSKLTARLARPTCNSCGTDLGGEPVGAHGIQCPSCGAVCTPGWADVARMNRADEDDDRA